MKYFFLLFIIITVLSIALFLSERKFQSVKTVAKSYDKWTNDKILESLWGEHIHLGFYKKSIKPSFKEAKVLFVHELVKWSGLSKLKKGSKILDLGCGIGGSSRILSQYYGFEVIGVTISPEQVKRARELTAENVQSEFMVMDALNLTFEDDSFDAVWSVEAGPHMPDKQRFSDEIVRVLKPNGLIAIADWNKKDDRKQKLNFIEKFVMKQLLNQWSHPEFSSIQGFRDNLLTSLENSVDIQTDDWTKDTLFSWPDSIIEGFRRPRLVLNFGLIGILKSLREVPTILLMYWAFSVGLMQFGVFRTVRDSTDI